MRRCWFKGVWRDCWWWWSTGQIRVRWWSGWQGWNEIFPVFASVKTFCKVNPVGPIRRRRCCGLWWRKPRVDIREWGVVLDWKKVIFCLDLVALLLLTWHHQRIWGFGVKMVECWLRVVAGCVDCSMPAVLIFICSNVACAWVHRGLIVAK